MANSTVYPYGTEGQLPTGIGIINDLTTGGADKALSAEMGKDLGTVTGALSFGIRTRDKDDALLNYKRNSSGYVTRVQLIYLVRYAPASVQASCSSGKGVSVNVYDTLEKARAAGSNYIETLTSYDYTASVNGTQTKAGYLCIQLAKTSGNFSASDIATYLANTSVTITEPDGADGEVPALIDRVRALEGMGLTLADADIYQTIAGSSTVSASGDRIRIVFPLLDMDYPLQLYATCTEGKGVAAAVYNTLTEAMIATKDYVQNIAGDYVSEVRASAVTPGYLVISLCKTDSSAITADEKAQLLGATTIHLATEHQMAGILAGDPTEPLDIGTLVQKAITATDLTDTNAEKRVSMLSKLAVPYVEAVLTFKLPKGICLGIRSGNKADDLSRNDFWYYDGDSFAFQPAAKYYRLSFGLNDGEDNLDLADIQTYIARGEIKIQLVSDYEPDIIKRNFDCEKYVKGTMRNFVSGVNNNGSLTKLPVFAHTSDTHGDMTRLDAMMRYCDFLGLDAAFVTGDIVAYRPGDSLEYALDVAKKHDTPLLPCVGNHDVYDVTAEADQSAMFKGLIDKAGGVYSATYPTYFYKDFTAKNIRVISLNLYETTHSGHNCNFTQTQAEWFISTLAATPAGYGVLVLFHMPEGAVDKETGKDEFYQEIANTWDTQGGMSLTGGPISKIVDAFISRTSDTITYTSKGVSITVTADFTAVATGAEFIAYLNGHEHIDRVGYLNGTTNRQLNLNVTCGIAIYGSTYPYLANMSDVPRATRGATQDAFNVYAIDRTAKEVRIARVGSNFSGDFRDRKYMAIAYAE